MTQQKTLVLVKPDGVRKHLIGEVISRFERRGLTVSALKLIKIFIKDSNFSISRYYEVCEKDVEIFLESFD